jgi:hypothetical protein
VAINVGSVAATVSARPSSAGGNSASGNSGLPTTPDLSLWEDAPLELTRRCVMMWIAGDSDTGRTTLAFTAPGPIAYIHAHEKYEGVLQNKANECMVRTHAFRESFPGTADEVQQAAHLEMAGVERRISDAYTWARTIIVDTDQALWKLCQIARLGSMIRAERSETDKKKGQLIYQEINNRWQNMVKEFNYRADNPGNPGTTNLIFIGGVSEEYKGDKATGRTIIKGQKDLYKACDVVVRTGYTMTLPVFGQPPVTTYHATIEKPWYEASARGVQVGSDEGTLSFAGIMTTITGDPDKWEK